MKRKKIKFSQWILVVILALIAAMCIIPMILVVIVSFSSEASLVEKGFSFFPTEWSLDAWEFVLGYGKQLIVSYGVTIFVTVTATVLHMLVESMFAYTLSRSTFMMRKYFSIMLLITMLFSGGQVAIYMVNVVWYHLKDSLAVLILNGGVSTIHVIIMRTYIQSTVSESLVESARIDGAGELRAFFRIVFPCMKPALASVGFMKAVEYWNGWQSAYLYINSPEKTPLALLLMKVEKNIQYLLDNAGTMTVEEYESMARNLPTDSGRMAILLAALGPILIAYPFFQKYFIKGIMMGSVKG